MKKKIFALLLICSLFQLPAYSAGKSRKVSDEVMKTLSELTQKNSDKTKIKTFKFACDELVNYKWGTSYKTIEKDLGKEILDKDDDAIIIASNNSNLPGTIVFCFTEKKLSGVSFISNKVFKDEKDYLNEFETVNKYLNEMYGAENCVKNEIPRKFLEKANTYIKKIKKGESYTNSWLVNDEQTYICQYIELNNDYEKEDPESPIFDVALCVLDASTLEEENEDEVAEDEEEEEDEEEADENIENDDDEEEAIEEKPAKSNKGSAADSESSKNKSKSQKKNEESKKSNHTSIPKYKGSCIDLVTFKWGDSSDKVKKEVQWPLISDTGNSLFYKGYYCKRTAEVEYIFENNKLTQVCYAFNVPNDKKEDYTNDFLDVCQAIYEKLGNCVHFDVPEDIEDNPGKVAQNVIKGKTELTTMYSYNNGKTGVRHFMRQMTTDDGSKPDCPVDHFIGVWDNSKKNLHKNLE